MATTEPEIFEIIIGFTVAGGPNMRLRGRVRVTDPVDGTTRISRDDMERTELVGDAWPALNTFLGKVLTKANDGRYNRTDVVFATPPEAP